MAYKKIFDDFECSICLNVAWSPAACTGCHKNFCTKCIDAHLKKNNKCPYCQEIFDRVRSLMNRNLKSILEDLTFDCIHCNQAFVYKNAQNHLKTCRLPKFACLNKCSSDMKYQSSNEFRVHLTVECPKINLSCKNCVVEVERGMIDSHDCIYVIKNRLREEKTHNK